jgi:dihydroorotate dehydrogenase (fumarate)
MIDLTRVDLSTTYLGLTLANPLVASASPLSKELDTALRLEDAGAGAMVMYSLFEEKMESEAQQLERFFYQQSLGHGEADSFHPVPDNLRTYQDTYLEQLRKLKSRLQIPVLASLNGTSLSGWLDYAQALQDAGADALELNIYHLAADCHEDGVVVENRYIEILQELKRHIQVPIALKLSAQFSSPVNFAKNLADAGADGLVLFNRFYQPDIDLETLQVVPKLELSTPSEALLRIRWTALMYGRVNASLAVTGGFHNTPEILKALLAGADCVQLCSVLLMHGPQRLRELLVELENWLAEHEYASVSQLKGSVSQQHAIDPSAYERANYVQVLDNYSCPAGVWR